MNDIPIPPGMIIPDKVYTEQTLTHAGKAIDDMTDAELIDASFNLESMLKNVEEKRKDPRFIKKMKNQPPPPINPHFLNVRSEIDKEIEKRGIAK